MNLKRHHVLYIFLALSLILSIVVLLSPQHSTVSFTSPAQSISSSTQSTSTNQINETITPVHFEVVTTEAAQERGLGGRSDIPENYGMLFVFSSDQNVGFWMKDMLVPIDIIWISDKGTIIGVEDSLSPSTYPKAYYPPQPVKYVLEMRAGEMRRQGWSIGTQISLPSPYSLPASS